MIWLIITALTCFLYLLVYGLCSVAGRCSRMEENEEMTHYYAEMAERQFREARLRRWEGE